MDRMQEILRQYFGYTDFRKGQRELIDAQLGGRDVFCVMPTGGGKSLCYQIPALMLEGVTFVISPLISLMKDQVSALKSNGIAAAYINSTLSFEQIRLVYHNLRHGMYKIVYIAPERLLTEEFISVARQLRIASVAVDEAHCISQWGQDFRTSYLKIVDFLEKLPYRPTVSAFTATATQQVQEDVARILQLNDPLYVVTGFDRPNLHYEVLRPKNRSAVLRELLQERRNKSGIIYCATRKEVEKCCQRLCDQGFSATRYHAGLSPEERQANQEEFIYDRCQIMVATNAFGMGIDKSNVSYVIHYNMPKSLEAYYQEAGRAGRDGEAADCILLYASGDVQTARFLIQNSTENEALSAEERRLVMQQDYTRLDVMIGYCKTTKCLRGYILDYFGQAHNACCGNCGNCQTDMIAKDITTEAQMILSCVRRIYDLLGYSLGAAMVIRVLRGSGEKRILQLGLDGLSTYGLMKITPRSELSQMIDCLIEEGYLFADPTHRGLRLTPQASGVLFCGKRVEMYIKQRSKKEPATKQKDSAITKPELTAAPDDLYAVLRSLRYRIAKEEFVPAYIVFSNATLSDMAKKSPATMAEFLQVSGVGEVKARRYGKIFLDEIKKYHEGV